MAIRFNLIILFGDSPILINNIAFFQVYSYTTIYDKVNKFNELLYIN